MKQAKAVLLSVAAIIALLFSGNEYKIIVLLTSLIYNDSSFFSTTFKSGNSAANSIITDPNKTIYNPYFLSGQVPISQRAYNKKFLAAHATPNAQNIRFALFAHTLGIR